MVDKAELIFPDYPRSAHYDIQWMLDNAMGPNVVWLAEALSQVMELKPEMRVLDMGCGKALSSIFLANEFGLQVWANDLWINPSDNWKRIYEAGMQKQVFPIRSEAHDLPYADDFFDAILSLDAYHYFGTDDLYLKSYFANLVKPGGQIGMIVPGLVMEFEQGLPHHLTPYWEDDFYSFHSPIWWQKHWEQSGVVEVERAELLNQGWKHWMMWSDAWADAGHGSSSREGDMLRADAGQNLGFVRMVAHRNFEER